MTATFGGLPMDGESAGKDKPDREVLLELGAFAESLASGLPAGLPAFDVAGTDAISLAVAKRMLDLDRVIHDGLLELKADVAALAFEIQDEASQ